MADRIKELPAKILAWWNKFTTKQKTAIIAIGAVVVFTFVILIYVFTQPQYILIQTCETTAQAAEVVDVLKGAGISNRVSTDGLRIEVETGQVSQAQLALGAAGYTPDTLDDLRDVLSGSMSTTASDKEKYYKEYMEKYLVSTLTALSNVKNAKVHLNIPEQNGTIASQAEEASAFVQLELDGTFTSANAANVAKVVATALGNETTNNIAIMDYDANMLYSGGDEYSSAGIANSMQELKYQAEAMVESQVKRVLLGTKQYGMIDVTSHLTMDFSSYEESVKEYYANEDREEGMYAHQEIFESENSGASGGPPGTDSNNENSYMWENYSDSSSSQSETLIDYLPNESLVNKITPAGGINYASSSISVAAITYKEIHEEDAKRQGLLDGISWEEYKANNSADRRLEVDPDFYEMVANATGISEENITIIAYETPVFYDKETMNISWTTILSIVMLVAILGLLAFVVMRSMTFRQDVPVEEELSVVNLLQSTPESELEDIDVEAKSETRRMIEKFVDDNPESAASLLRNWLTEEWS